MIRQAISPRLAISILWIGGIGDEVIENDKGLMKVMMD
jgi:hypothetical protein